MKTLYVLFLFFLLSGCTTNQLFKTRTVKGICNDKGDDIELGRIKFNIDLDTNWVYVWRKKEEIVSFHFSQDGHTSAINVTSYTNKFNNYDLQWDEISSIENQYISYAESVRKGSSQFSPNIEVNVVKVGNFDCVKYYEKLMAPYPSVEYNIEFSGGYEELISFTCVVPSQPELLPIRVGMGQSVGRQKKPFNMEKILTHVIQGIVLNPSPPETQNSIPKRKYPPWKTWGTEEKVK